MKKEEFQAQNSGSGHGIQDLDCCGWVFGLYFGVWLTE